jgi:hypothetical protein
MASNTEKGNRRQPRTVNPRQTDAKPLSLEFFEQPEREESFSTEVVRRLKGSPFFRPDTNTDGSITEHTLLTIASVVIAAADREIATTQLVRERLVWWNSPLFQKPVTDADVSGAGGGVGDDGNERNDPQEFAFFSKYLTLRNIVGVVVAITLTAWTIFNWVDSKNAVEVQHWKDKLTTAEAEQKSLQDRFDFIDKHSGEQDTELKETRGKLDKAKQDAADAKVSIQGLTDKLGNLNGELVAAKQRAITAESELGKTKSSIASDLSATAARATTAEAQLAACNTRAAGAEGQLAECRKGVH